MPRKNPTRKHIDPKEAFHLPAILQVALEARAFAPAVAATKTSILKAALEKMLEAEGYWPCPPEIIKKLVAKKKPEDFSPQARQWLIENGYLEA